jgi:hypothetical protein
MHIAFIELIVAHTGVILGMELNTSFHLNTVFSMVFQLIPSTPTNKEKHQTLVLVFFLFPFQSLAHFFERFPKYRLGVSGCALEI